MLCGTMWYIIGHWECWLVTLLTGRIYIVYDQYIYYVGYKISQNVSNKSCLVCAMSEKYSFWVTLRPQSDRCYRG